jgi:hypothetical protein
MMINENQYNSAATFGARTHTGHVQKLTCKGPEMQISKARRSDAGITADRQLEEEMTYLIVKKTAWKSQTTSDYMTAVPNIAAEWVAILFCNKEFRGSDLSSEIGSALRVFSLLSSVLLS